VTITDTPVGQIRSDFYGVNIQNGIWFVDGTQIDSTNNGVLDILANSTYHSQMFLNAGLKTIRKDMNIQGNYKNWTGAGGQYGGINRTGDLTNITNLVTWAYNNGVKVTFIIDYMGSVWANNTSGYCSGLNYCYPNNYTYYNSMVLDFIGNVSNTTTRSAIELEFWNEPDLNTFMGGLADGSLTKLPYYIEFYNQTYNGIKAVYPTIPFGGLAISALDTANRKSYVTQFIANLSFDFLTIHDYDEVYANHNSWILGNCTLYGKDCSDIRITEFNIRNSTETNTSAYSTLYSTKWAKYYTALFNTNTNVSFQGFTWSNQFFYNRTSDYTGYPYRWSYLAELSLDNSLYAPYNITKTFATNHKAGNTVLTSSSSDTDIKVVVSNDSTKEYITLTNTNSGTKSGITISGIKSGVNALIDNATGEQYGVVSGSATIPTLDGYEVQTLQTRTYKLYANFTTLIGQVRSDFYGINVQRGLTQYDTIATSGACTTLGNANYTDIQNKVLTAGIRNLRSDMNVHTYVNSSLELSSSPLEIGAKVKFAYDNNLTIILIADYMPSWLADNNTGSGNCKDLRYCPPSNYTVWGQAMMVLFNNLTNNGQYANNVIVEVWNEPMSNFWLNSAGSYYNYNKSVEYNKLYNATYDAVKVQYPNTKVIGLGGSSGLTGSNVFYSDTPFVTNWFGNFSNKADGYSLHGYYQNLSVSENYTDMIDTFRNVCLSKGASYCNNIYLTEWNTNNKPYFDTVNQSSTLAGSYTTFLNQNISMVSLYKLTSPYINSSCDTEYNYSFVSENQLNNAYYISYNITKTFAKYAPRLSNIYQSSGDATDIKIVSNKIGTTDNIILTNTLGDARDVILETDNMNSNLLMDAQTGELYDTSSGTLSLGVMDAYEIKYLTTPYYELQGGDWWLENYLGEDIRELTNDEARELDLSEICTESNLTFIEASAIAGILLTIILIGGVITILLMSFNGFIDIDGIRGISLEEVIGGILVIGLLFLVIATMSFLMGGTYCPTV